MAISRCVNMHFCNGLRCVGWADGRDVARELVAECHSHRQANTTATPAAAAVETTITDHNTSSTIVAHHGTMMPPQSGSLRGMPEGHDGALRNQRVHAHTDTHTHITAFQTVAELQRSLLAAFAQQFLVWITWFCLRGGVALTAVWALHHTSNHTSRYTSRHTSRMHSIMINILTLLLCGAAVDAQIVLPYSTPILSNGVTLPASAKLLVKSWCEPCEQASGTSVYAALRGSTITLAAVNTTQGAAFSVARTAAFAGTSEATAIAAVGDFITVADGASPCRVIVVNSTLARITGPTTMLPAENSASILEPVNTTAVALVTAASPALMIILSVPQLSRMATKLMPCNIRAVARALTPPYPLLVLCQAGLYVLDANSLDQLRSFSGFSVPDANTLVTLAMDNTKPEVALVGSSGSPPRLLQVDYVNWTITQAWNFSIADVSLQSVSIAPNGGVVCAVVNGAKNIVVLNNTSGERIGAAAALTSQTFVASRHLMISNQLCLAALHNSGSPTSPNYIRVSNTTQMPHLPFGPIVKQRSLLLSTSDRSLLYVASDLGPAEVSTISAASLQPIALKQFTSAESFGEGPGCLGDNESKLFLSNRLLTPGVISILAANTSLAILAKIHLSAGQGPVLSLGDWGGYLWMVLGTSPNLLLQYDYVGMQTISITNIPLASGTSAAAFDSYLARFILSTTANPTVVLSVSLATNATMSLPLSGGEYHWHNIPINTFLWGPSLNGTIATAITTSNNRLARPFVFISFNSATGSGVVLGRAGFLEGAPISTTLRRLGEDVWYARLQNNIAKINATSGVLWDSTAMPAQYAYVDSIISMPSAVVALTTTFPTMAVAFAHADMSAEFTDALSVPLRRNFGCYETLPGGARRDVCRPGYDVIAGFEASCAITEELKPICWGTNLNINAYDWSLWDNTPLSVTLNGTVGIKAPEMAVAAGTVATCVVTRSGITCWGDGTVPVTTAPQESIVHISMGYTHACALRAVDGSIVCWGNPSGSLLAAPTGPFATVSAGATFSCGIFQVNGSLSCWGASVIPPSGAFKAISVGSGFACALRASDSVPSCFGTGIPTGTPSSSLSAIDCGTGACCGILLESQRVQCWGSGLAVSKALTNTSMIAIAISKGSKSFACGILQSNKTLQCWGTVESYLTEPPWIPGQQVACGESHCCYITVSGDVDCWGEGANRRSFPPRGPIDRMVLGTSHVCVLRPSGRAHCYGAAWTAVTAPSYLCTSLTAINMATSYLCYNSPQATRQSVIHVVAGGFVATYTPLYGSSPLRMQGRTWNTDYNPHSSQSSIPLVFMPEPLEVTAYITHENYYHASTICVVDIEGLIPCSGHPYTMGIPYGSTLGLNLYVHRARSLTGCVLRAKGDVLCEGTNNYVMGESLCFTGTTAYKVITMFYPFVTPVLLTSDNYVRWLHSTVEWPNMRSISVSAYQTRTSICGATLDDDVKCHDQHEVGESDFPNLLPPTTVVIPAIAIFSTMSHACILVNTTSMLRCFGAAKAPAVKRRSFSAMFFTRSYTGSAESDCAAAAPGGVLAYPTTAPEMGAIQAAAQAMLPRPNCLSLDWSYAANTLPMPIRRSTGAPYNGIPTLRLSGALGYTDFTRYSQGPPMLESDGTHARSPNTETGSCTGGTTASSVCEVRKALTSDAPPQMSCFDNLCAVILTNRTVTMFGSCYNDVCRVPNNVSTASLLALGPFGLCYIAPVSAVTSALSCWAAGALTTVVADLDPSPKHMCTGSKIVCTSQDDPNVLSAITCRYISTGQAALPSLPNLRHAACFNDTVCGINALDNLVCTLVGTDAPVPASKLVSMLPVASLAISSFSLSSQHGCVILSTNATARCWGTDESGSVSGVPLGEPILQIATGYKSTCMVTFNRTVRCYGRHLPAFIKRVRNPLRASITNVTVDSQQGSDDPLACGPPLRLCRTLTAALTLNRDLFMQVVIADVAALDTTHTITAQNIYFVGRTPTAVLRIPCDSGGVAMMSHAVTTGKFSMSDLTIIQDACVDTQRNATHYMSPNPIIRIRARTVVFSRLVMSNMTQARLFADVGDAASVVVSSVSTVASPGLALLSISNCSIVDIQQLILIDYFATYLQVPFVMGSGCGSLQLNGAVINNSVASSPILRVSTVSSLAVKDVEWHNDGVLATERLGPRIFAAEQVTSLTIWNVFVAQNPAGGEPSDVLWDTCTETDIERSANGSFMSIQRSEYVSIYNISVVGLASIGIGGSGAVLHVLDTTNVAFSDASIIDVKSRCKGGAIFLSRVVNVGGNHVHFERVGVMLSQGGAMAVSLGAVRRSALRLEVIACNKTWATHTKNPSIGSPGASGGCIYAEINRKGSSIYLSGLNVLGSSATGSGGAVWIGEAGQASTAAVGYKSSTTTATAANAQTMFEKWVYASENWYQFSTLRDAGLAASAPDTWAWPTAPPVLDVTLIESSFTDSVTAQKGGCIVFAFPVDSSSRVAIRDVDFIRCSASGSGGALALVNEAMIIAIKNSRFMANTADDGAAIAFETFTTTNSTLLCVNVTITNNSASSAGGAVFAHNANIRMANSTVSQNIANEGGAITTITGSLAAYGTQFTDNVAALNGGMLYSYNAVFRTINFTSCRIDRNTATTGSGGAAYISMIESVTFADCNFSFNIAERYGGAIFLEEFKSMWMLRSTARNSTADEGGTLFARSGDIIGLYNASIEYPTAAHEGLVASIENVASALLFNARILVDASSSMGASLLHTTSTTGSVCSVVAGKLVTSYVGTCARNNRSTSACEGCVLSLLGNVALHLFGSDLLVACDATDASCRMRGNLATTWVYAAPIKIVQPSVVMNNITMPSLALDKLVVSMSPLTNVAIEFAVGGRTEVQALQVVTPTGIAVCNSSTNEYTNTSMFTNQCGLKTGSLVLLGAVTVGIVEIKQRFLAGIQQPIAVLALLDIFGNVAARDSTTTCTISAEFADGRYDVLLVGAFEWQAQAGIVNVTRVAVVLSVVEAELHFTASCSGVQDRVHWSTVVSMPLLQWLQPPPTTVLPASIDTPAAAWSQPVLLQLVSPTGTVLPAAETAGYTCDLSSSTNGAQMAGTLTDRFTLARQVAEFSNAWLALDNMLPTATVVAACTSPAGLQLKTLTWELNISSVTVTTMTVPILQPSSPTTRVTLSSIMGSIAPALPFSIACSVVVDAATCGISLVGETLQSSTPGKSNITFADVLAFPSELPCNTSIKIVCSMPASAIKFASVAVPSTFSWMHVSFTKYPHNILAAHTWSSLELDVVTFPAGTSTGSSATELDCRLAAKTAAPPEIAVPLTGTVAFTGDTSILDPGPVVSAAAGGIVVIMSTCTYRRIPVSIVARTEPIRCRRLHLKVDDAPHSVLPAVESTTMNQFALNVSIIDSDTGHVVDDLTTGYCQASGLNGATITGFGAPIVSGRSVLSALDVRVNVFTPTIGVSVTCAINVAYSLATVVQLPLTAVEIGVVGWPQAMFPHATLAGLSLNITGIPTASHFGAICTLNVITVPVSGSNIATIVSFAGGTKLVGGTITAESTGPKLISPTNVTVTPYLMCSYSMAQFPTPFYLDSITVPAVQLNITSTTDLRQPLLPASSSTTEYGRYDLIVSLQTIDGVPITELVSGSCTMSVADARVTAVGKPATLASGVAVLRDIGWIAASNTSFTAEIHCILNDAITVSAELHLAIVDVVVELDTRRSSTSLLPGEEGSVYIVVTSSMTPLQGAKCSVVSYGPCLATQLAGLPFTGSESGRLGETGANGEVTLYFVADTGTQLQAAALAISCNVFGLTACSRVHVVRLDTLSLETETAFPTKWYPAGVGAEYFLDPPPAFHVRTQTGTRYSGVAVKCFLEPADAVFNVRGTGYSMAIDWRVVFVSIGLSAGFHTNVSLTLSCSRVGSPPFHTQVIHIWIDDLLLEWRTPPPSAAVSQRNINLAFLTREGSGPSATVDRFTTCRVDFRNPAARLTGAEVFQIAPTADSGNITFTTFSVRARIGSALDLVVQCTWGNQLAISNTLDWHLQIAQCPPGTQPGGSHMDECLPCGDQAWSDGGMSHCISCPRNGASCAGGVLRLQGNYFLARPQGASDDGGGNLTLSDSTEMHACRLPGVCLFDAVERTFYCKEGYSGPLCEVCDKTAGYVKFGSGCAPCGTRQVNKLYLVLLCVGIAGALVFITFKHNGAGSPTSVYKKTLLSHVQALGALGLYKARGTAVFREIMGLTAYVGGSLLMAPPIECEWDVGFYGKLYGTLLLPPIVAAASLLLRAAYFLVRRDMERLRRYWQDRQFISTAVVVLYLMYMPLCSTSFAVYSCYDTPIAGTRYLSSDFTVACFDSRHYVALLMSTLALVVYGVGIPVLLYYILSRRKFDDKDGDAAFFSRYGFLFNGYNSSYIWWESVIMVRKAFIVLLAMVISDPYYQVLASVLLMLAAYSLQLVCRPFQAPDANRAEVASLAAVLLTQVCCIWYLRHNGNSAFASPSVVVDFFVTAILLLLNIGAIAYTIRMRLINDLPLLTRVTRMCALCKRKQRIMTSTPPSLPPINSGGSHASNRFTFSVMLDRSIVKTEDALPTQDAPKRLPREQRRFAYEPTTMVQSAPEVGFDNLQSGPEVGASSESTVPTVVDNPLFKARMV